MDCVADRFTAAGTSSNRLRTVTGRLRDSRTCRARQPPR
jgi:hypothetical protein